MFKRIFLVMLTLMFMASLTVGTARAMDEQTQKTIAKVAFAIPGPGWIAGFFYSWSKAGEMAYTEEYIRAVRENKPRPAGNETSRGLAYMTFKGLSTAPEGIAVYGVGQSLFLLKYDQLDPLSVWTAYGRPYWLDATVISTKAAFGVMGAYAADVGLPALGHSAGAPINQAFYWMAAGGGSLNLLTGTANQAMKGASPYKKYYSMHRWWSGNKPLK